MLLALLLLVSSVSAAFADESEYMDAGLLIFHKINLARHKPLDAVVEAGLDPDAIRAGLGVNGYLMDQGMDPVAWNNDLFSTSLDHCNDMLKNVYYSYASQDGTTVQQRISATGYEYVQASESLGILIFDAFIEPVAAAQIMFDNMFRDEMGGVPGLPPGILNPLYTEVGIAFAAGVVDIGQKLPVNVYLVAVDFAKPLQQRGFVIGNVFLDSDQDGEFSSGEALEGMTMVLRNLSIKKDVSMVAGPLGLFQFESSPGFLILQAEDSSGVIAAQKNLFGDNRNRYLNLKYDSWFY
jgi:hypothetical protein